MKTLGKYELLSELGRGAMGVVYKARDPLIGRRVAVKTITSGLEAKSELLELFYHEARSVGSLQHPNIVTIYEFGEADGIPFIAMEYLEGESLDRIVTSRPVLPLFLKLRYIVRTCEALDHAHRHGVVHRDVRPSNIMVTKDDAVKVVDFGIARLADASRTQANLMIRSRPYMSPQLYEGERADERSDIWAVGVTLYELLALQRPFAGENEAALMDNILHHNPPSLRSLSIDCSEEIDRIIVRMLEKKVEARFQNMRDLLRDLEPHWRAAQQVALNGLLADSRQLVEAHDLERAQSLLRKALHFDVGNVEAESLLEQVTAQLRHYPVQPRIDEDLTRERGLLQAGHSRDADVAQSLKAVQAELGERDKRQEEQQQFEAAKTMLEAGRYAEASQLLNHAMATRTLLPTDPRTQLLLAQIQQHSMTSSLSPRLVKEPPPAQTAIETAAGSTGKSPVEKELNGPDVTPPTPTMLSPTQDSRLSRAPDSSGARRARKNEFGMKSASAEGRPPASHGDELFGQSKNLSAPPVRVLKTMDKLAEMWRWIPLDKEKFTKQPAVLLGLAVLGICVLGAVWWIGKSHAARPSADEAKAKTRALQLWSSQELDLSEQEWKQLALRPGALQNEAIAQVQQIEDKRAAEKKRFAEGEALLIDQKDYLGAQKVFEEVIAMNLWLSAAARKELDTAKALAAGADSKKQEQNQFEQGKEFFQTGNFEQAERAFKNVLTLDLPDSLLRPQAESYLKKIRQSLIDKKIFDSALEELKNENWTQARNGFTEIVNRGGPLTPDAKKQLALIQSVQKMLEAFSNSLNGGSYQTAKNEVEAARSWPKTQGKMLQQLVSTQQQELSGLRGRSQSLAERGDVGGLEHLQDDVHRFSTRAEDSSVIRAANSLDKSIAAAILKSRDDQSSAKAAFDAAVRNFEKAKENGDINQLNHDVIPAFQQIANGNGMYAGPAKQYLQSTIPNAIQQVKKAFAGKAVVPPIECRGHGLQGVTPGRKASVECGQLDATAPLEWVGRPTVDLPDSANRPGKLPYILQVIVVVDPDGSVKLEKVGTVDNDFFKKAKEAAKHWKTTIPLSSGKPVSVKFPMEINFPR